MKLNKSEIYNILKTIKLNNVSVKSLQENTENPKEIPCTTYHDMTNVPKYCINNQIAYQLQTVVIDCWNKTSANNTLLFQELSNKLNEAGWHCIETNDEGKQNKKYKISSKWRKEIYE